MDKHLIARTVTQADLGVIISDPSQDDNPIVYVNAGFERLTLYRREEVIGRNCRFLQGDETAPADQEQLRSAVHKAEETIVRILNYKADGTPFVNQLVVSPVFNDEGTLTAFLGVQREVEQENDQGTGGGGRPTHSTNSLEMLREIQHRVKNHLAMIVSLVRMHANRRITNQSFHALSHRIETLALLYDQLLQPGQTEGSETIETGAYLTRIAEVVAGIDGRTSVRMNVDCEEVELAVDPAARLGLLLSELLTNCFAHAFDGRERGHIQIRFAKTAGNWAQLVVEDDGIGLPEGSNWPYNADTIEEQREEAETASGDLDTTSGGQSSGLGGSIVLGLTKQLNADLDVQRKDQGTRIVISLQAT